MKKIPGKDEAMGAVETSIDVIEKIDGDLREGLEDTPKGLLKHLSNYTTVIQWMQILLLDATFNAEGYDGIVLLRDIDLIPLGEHHMLPFTGAAHVAYIPIEKSLESVS